MTRVIVTDEFTIDCHSVSVHISYKLRR